MKRHLLFLMCLLGMARLSAQQRLVVVTSEGTMEPIPVWKIDHIKILDFEKPETAVPTEEQTVVLNNKSGLRWAPWNVGAADASEVGFLFGWGNPDPENHSTDLKYFPSASKEISNIVESEHDIAKYYWGKDWRMPVAEDFQELLGCLWTWDGELNAYKVANPDDEEQYIYLPVTGSANGEEDSGEGEGFYWSGSAAGVENASYLHFPSDSEDLTLWQVLEALRSNRFAVRPVYGEYRKPVTIVSTGDELREPTTVAINITLDGEAETAEYGILYSLVSGFSDESAERSTTYKLTDFDGTLNNTILIYDLDYSTTYYYRAYVKVGQDIITEEEHSITTGEDNRIVDLGLSVKWARWNIGASGISGYGSLYAWGETSSSPVAFNGDDITNLNGTVYDYAHEAWGDEWRMPTRADFEELYKYCDKEYAKIDGTSGIKFIRNGDFVFFPFTGVGSKREWVGQAGYYWTSEHSAGYNAFQCMLQAPIFEDYFQITATNKSGGHAIRAVYGPSDPNNFIGDKDDDNGDDNGGGNNGGDNGDDGDDDGGDNGPDQPDTSPKEVEAIDLGLPSGTRWANMNVGATNEYESGDYYSWGEVEPKENYLLKEYLYYDTNTTKYEMIGKATVNTYVIAGQAEYDPATKNWGEKWCMPTDEQFQELIENCTWTWQTPYGLAPGYLIKSKKNGNSIYLPAVSYYQGRNRGENGNGRYWTASWYPFDKQDRFSWAIEITPNNRALLYNPRQDGMPIRPVMPK